MIDRKAEIERAARAIAAEIGRQDDEPFPLGDELKLAWPDLGEFDFGLIATAAITPLLDRVEELHEALIGMHNAWGQRDEFADLGLPDQMENAVADAARALSGR